MDPTIRLLSDLVAIDSVNPSLVPGAAGEGEIAKALAAELQAIGLDVEIDEVRTGRPNVTGVIEGRRPGRTLVLCGHLDTVGVEGMEAPFSPVVRQGRLYGRGAQDMKGGIAAMVGAARAIVEGPGLDCGRLVIAGVVDEEHSSLGAESWVGTHRGDAAIVTEPTDLAVAVSHKGFVWLEITTRGRAAHGSRPTEGRDAILRMGRVLARLEELDRTWGAGIGHPVLGRASLHASFISGGRELSSYPDNCRLTIERRTLPGETPEAVFGEVEGLLQSLREVDPEFEGTAEVTFSRPPYELAQDQEPARLLRTVVTDRIGRCRITGMSFWTDAAILGGSGIPSALFGPSGAGLHSIEEYVDIDSVMVCRDVLAGFARRFCESRG
jgi:acetylornithine deacetylase